MGVYSCSDDDKTSFVVLGSGTPLVVQFNPNGPGHYPTQITLKSPSDVRV